MSNEIIGVMGAGAMGRGIAQIALEGGYEVRLWDMSAEACKEAEGFIGKMLARKVEKGQMEQADCDAAVANLKVLDDQSGYQGCTIIVEAILEDLDVKQKVFSGLEEIVDADCVLSTNTSSLSVTAIASVCKHPNRVAGFHFFNPVPLMKVVEVVDGVETDEKTVQRLTDFANQMGHRPVGAKDMPGFLVNHAGRAFGTEAFRILGEGVSDYWLIDDIMKEAGGFRMGPFELLDLTGLDVSLKVMESIYNQFFQEPKYRPSAIATQRVAGGLYGRKTGRGFYVYEDGKRQPLPRPEARGDLPKAIWAGAASAEVQEIVKELCAQNNVSFEDGLKPSADAVCLISPTGKDATTSALELGLEPARTMAIDGLVGLKSHRTLMSTPVTDEALRAGVHALFATDAVPVTLVHDSPGFVAQRIIAQIVNIGCDIAQQRIASPDDIDPAVKLGLGYPRGPLEFGDWLGAQTVLDILNALYDFYGEDRYRASPWLKRRAALGVSLTTPES